MLDRCSGPDCSVTVFVSNVDTYKAPGRKWYCSPVCRDVATRPMHWLEPGTHVAACGGTSLDTHYHLLTADLSLVTCENCKRTGLYRKAAAA
jgi:hypothetical protein